jgi:hypothetical protein
LKSLADGSYAGFAANEVVGQPSSVGRFAHHARTRSFGARYSFSPGFTLNAVCHSSMLRTGAISDKSSLARLLGSQLRADVGARNNTNLNKRPVKTR